MREGLQRHGAEPLRARGQLGLGLQRGGGPHGLPAGGRLPGAEPPGAGRLHLRCVGLHLGGPGGAVRGALQEPLHGGEDGGGGRRIIEDIEIVHKSALTHLYTYYIWHSPGHPHPPPPGMVMVPCPAPCGSGWGGCGWVGMLVDGVVVFANDVESYGICKELDLVRERRQTWKAHSLMMGQ